MNSDNRIGEQVLIVEGGAMRSVFSAGLLDGFLQNSFDPFDAYLGVSAGACNLISFLAGEEGKNFKTYLQVAKSRRFINLPRFLCGGPLLDMRWLFDEVVLNNINSTAPFRHGKPLLIGTTDVASGNAVYIRANPINVTDLLKASMSLPVLSTPSPTVNGRAMVDGGISDAIPVAEAIKMGAKKIMVVRSRPSNYVKRDTPMHQYIRWRVRHHPELAATLKKRVQKHLDTAQLLDNPPSGITVVDICPPADFYMGRFGQNQKWLVKGYQAGLKMASSVIDEWMGSPPMEGGFCKPSETASFGRSAE